MDCFLSFLLSFPLPFFVSLLLSVCMCIYLSILPSINLFISLSPSLTPPRFLFILSINLSTTFLSIFFRGKQPDPRSNLMHFTHFCKRCDYFMNTVYALHNEWNITTRLTPLFIWTQNPSNGDRVVVCMCPPPPSPSSPPLSVHSLPPSWVGSRFPAVELSRDRLVLNKSC